MPRRPAATSWLAGPGAGVEHVKQGILIYGLLILSALVTACASSSSPDVYSRHQVRKAYAVYNATLVDIRYVEIEGRSTRVGTLGGAWIGSAAGRSVGGGRGSRIAGAVGGVAGAVAGQGIEREITEHQGVELLLELDNGELVAVVQGAEVSFAIGEQVRVLRDGNSARVIKRR